MKGIEGFFKVARHTVGRPSLKARAVVALLAAPLALGACSSSAPDAPELTAQGDTHPVYIIGPGDNLDVFVWRSPELSTSVPVRPDGRISMPLVADMIAAGKTPADLAKDVETELGEYVQSPLVTIIVKGFSGPYSQQVRIVGQASEPRALPYRDGMSVLDAMIEVGGLTDFADGNDAILLRQSAEGPVQRYRVRIDDLLNEGDLKANARLLPGDIIVIPESWF